MKIEMPLSMAYMYYEPCGCVTSVMMATAPGVAKQLANWGRRRPEGHVALVPTAHAREQLNLKYPKEHSHPVP